MKIMIATDAWHPQINGVVRSLEHTAAAATKLGIEVSFLTPEGFRTVPMPTYDEIRLSLARPSRVAAHIDRVAPTHIHVATEGPLGILTRRYCLKRRRGFTTSYHTRFPEYLSARIPVPERLTYAWLRSFHNAGSGVMVATDTLERTLTQYGFNRIMRWSRGVDTNLFRPRETSVLDLPRPIFLTVGRVAVEKNLEAFLALDLPGSKVVVGDGPARADLQQRYPQAVFLGVRQGEALAEVFASADVFVFPSRTDTFGIVLLEALASGVPVAAYPVMGPLDVIGGKDVGVLDEDLQKAALAALEIPSERCRAEALRYTWAESARQFVNNISQAAAAARSR
jgi:glycosyltransferase involved in cell wall biosynthesis